MVRICNNQNKLRFRIGKAFISITNLEDTINSIKYAVSEKLNIYICVSNMRMVRYANNSRNRNYLNLMQRSYLNLPDGTPLVWCARLWGLKNVKCTSGPVLFDLMLNNRADGLSHFLLGDTDETLELLVKKYSNDGSTNIVGTYSPPFIEVNDYDYKFIADTINKSGCDIVWISMRAPKQDFFSERISELLDKKVCIAVGRAFRIAIGNVKDAPKAIQKFGISGIFTRRVSLGRAIGWYFQSSFFLFYYFFQIIIRRIIRKEYFE